MDSGAYQVVVANPVALARSAVAQVSVQTVSGISETTNNYFSNRISINPLLGPVLGNNQNAFNEPGDPEADGKPGGKSIWYSWTASFTGVISLTTLGSDFDTLLAVYTGNQLSKLAPVVGDDDSGGFFTSLVTFDVTAGTEYVVQVDGFNGVSGNVVLGLPSGTGYRVLSAGSGNSVPVITQQPPVVKLVQAGAEVVLNVGATGAQSYQWYFQGSPVSGATASSLVLTNFQAGSVGLYDVLVANAVGSVLSEQTSVQVVAQGQPGTAISAQDKFGSAVDFTPPNEGQASLRGSPEAGGGDTRGFSISQTFSTVGATRDAAEPDHCGQAGGASEWYIYTAPAGGNLHVTTAGSTYNTILGVYTGPASSFAQLVERGCGYTTNYQANGQPEVTIHGVAAGTQFYIVVDGYHGEAGTAQLQVGLGAAPALVTLPANQLVVPGGKATFSVQAVGSTNFYYQWKLNGVDIPHATGSSYTVTNAGAASAGNYTVVVANVVGSTNSPPATLTLQYAPGLAAQTSNQTVLLGKKAALAVTAIGVLPLQYQWWFAPPGGGYNLLADTTNTLSFPQASWANDGNYFAVVSNSYGMVTSAVMALAVQDPALPKVAILSPPAGFATNGDQVLVSGTASDSLGVAEVEVAVNNNGYQPAAGLANWSSVVALAPGTNLIAARSVNVAGTNSLPVYRSVFYQMGSPLVVQTNAGGMGRITSPDGATNGALLNIGQDYHVIATATASNWVFANWTSGTPTSLLSYYSSASNLVFPMASNLVLQANFVTNPFPAALGSYSGLFYPAGGVTEASSGAIAVTLSGNTGAYTAKLQLDGGVYPFSGSFGLLGAAGSLSAQVQTNLPRLGTNAVSIVLNLDLSPPGNQITGWVSNAAWYAGELRADLALFSTNNPATNYAGQYTLVLPPGLVGPDGYGYAAVSNSAAGQSKVGGALGDGTAFVWSGALAQDGSIPFYQSLYGGKGSVLGWLAFTNQPPQTLAGWVNWVKPPGTVKTIYPPGWTNLVTVLGSAYTVPSAGQSALPLAGGTLTLDGGGLAGSVNYNNLTVGNTLTNGMAPPDNLGIVISTNNGLITVTFRAAGSKTNTTGHGVLLQNQTNAYGVFLLTNQPGAIILR
jgi:hypothetical protein